MEIIEYIKPELAVLAVMLYLVGMGLKSSKVKDKLIPYLLGGAGVVLACLWVCATSDLSTGQNIMMALFTGITQGVLCAGTSVYINQLIKQGGKAE